MLSVPTYIKYIVKQKLKTSAKYLDDLKSPLEESTVFWNAGEGLAEDLAIRTLEILNSTPLPIPLMGKTGFNLKFGNRFMWIKISVSQKEWLL